MNSSVSEMVEGNNEKPKESDQDPKPNIPLRQRRLPASFWQEPCMSPSPSSREIFHSNVIPPSAHQLPTTPLHPWTLNSSGTTIPVYVPQRLMSPNNFLSTQNPQWIRGGSSGCCTCAACLNYSYVIPRLPEVYNGLRYRSTVNVPCCPVINCIDQSCKLCSASERWHPDRLRHFRLRAARYNAMLD